MARRHTQLGGPDGARPGESGRLLRRPVRLGRAAGRRGDRLLRHGDAAGASRSPGSARPRRARRCPRCGRPTWPCPMWTRTAAAITEAGGQIVVPVMDVMKEGRMAVAVDPAGAVFGLWEPGNHIGTQVTAAPGTPGLERVHEPRLPGGEGVLRAGLRLTASRTCPVTTSRTRCCCSTAARSAGSARLPGVGAGGGAVELVGVLLGGGRRRERGQGGRARRPGPGPSRSTRRTAGRCGSSTTRACRSWSSRPTSSPASRRAGTTDPAGGPGAPWSRPRPSPVSPLRRPSRRSW